MTTQIEASKLNTFNVLTQTDARLSKTNTFNVLTQTDARVSKMNTYLVLLALPTLPQSFIMSGPI